jgi:hypothetical protein
MFMGDYFCRCGQLSNSKKAVFWLSQWHNTFKPWKCSDVKAEAERP